MANDLRGEIARRNENAPTAFDLLRNMEHEFAKALPTTLPLERFMRLALTELRQKPELCECTSASLLGALMVSAQLGLEVGPLQHFYLTPRRIKGVKTVVPIIGYRGMVELARRSGQLLSIVARPVKANDYFEYEYGLDERLVHRPLLNGDRGETVAFYGVAKFIDGGHAVEVMSLEDVEGRKARGAAGDSGPWSTDYDAMGAKTVIRQMQRWLPQTAEMALAAQVDEQPQMWRADADTSALPEPPVIEQTPDDPAGGDQ